MKPPIRRTKERNLLALRKKTAPAEITKRTPIEISIPNTKPAIDALGHSEEAHLMNKGSHGVAMRTTRRYP